MTRYTPQMHYAAMQSPKADIILFQSMVGILVMLLIFLYSKYSKYVPPKVAKRKTRKSFVQIRPRVPMKKALPVWN